MQNWYRTVMRIRHSRTKPPRVSALRVAEAPWNDSYEYYLSQGLRYRVTGASFYANWIKEFSFYGSVQSGTGVN